MVFKGGVITQIHEKAVGMKRQLGWEGARNAPKHNENRDLR